MASLINFESSCKIENERAAVREARQIALQKAKEKYEKEERKKDLAKQRGEDTWMLPAVSSRVDNEQQNLKAAKKKKKEKKKKKHKEKEKKKKKKRKRETSSSSDSSSEDESSMWVEKGSKVSKPDYPETAVRGPRMERDSWMNEPTDFLSTVTRQDLNDRKNKEKEEIDKQKQLLQAPGQHAKELNPHWKDGGTGVPEDKVTKDVTMVTGVGDSGLSWLRTSYQRVVEQAKEEGKDLEELATQRWGSLKTIQKMIKDAEAATGQGQRSERSNERSNTHRDRFMKPSDNDSNSDSFYKDRRKRLPSRSPSRHSDSKNSAYSRNKKSSSRSRSKDRKQRSRSRERYRRSRSRSHERQRYRDRSNERKRSRSRDRRRSREHHRQRSRSPDRYSKSSSAMKSRFMKPGDMEDSGDKRSSSSARAPAWKKKEFHKPLDTDDTANVRSETRDKQRDRDSVKEKEQRRRHSTSESSETSSESSSEDSESDDPRVKGQSSRSQPSEPEVKILTEKEMNELGAKIVKAEIMGNQAQADKLKAQLEGAREAKKNAPAVTVKEGRKKEVEEDDFVTLTRTDRSGMARPVPESKHTSETWGGKRRKKQKEETHTGKQGERTKYFADDDKYDLKRLVEREKMGTAEDQNQMFARLAGRATERADDDFQVDDIIISKANTKQSESIEEQRERSQAIYEHRKMATALEKCQFCFSNVPKHLIIAIGTKSYLCLPHTKSLTEGHCMIVPMQHVASGTALDEDVWSEIQVFRKCLTSMFTGRDEDVVFMETSMRLKQFPHMVLECVPIEKEVGDLAPIYFKKAIQESESEWSQNKKVVDLSNKDIRRAVPKGFPYFSVDFGNQGGFAHVIEDEQRFSHYFGKEIIGGMIDAEHRLWRKPPKENFDDQRKKVLKFADMWKPHDWTQNISKKTMEDDSSSDSDSD